MNYFEYMLTVLFILSIIDLIRWWISKRVYKDMIEILLASGGDWNITTKIRHGIETIIVIFWLSWVVWKFIIC